jgi:hypothetical protein
MSRDARTWDLWNVFRNPDFPNRRQQRNLTRMVCASQGAQSSCRRAPDVLGEADVAPLAAFLRSLNEDYE